MKKEKLQNNPLIIATYGGAPRASKTSKKVVVGGLKLFYQVSKAGTGGMVLIWSNVAPYQKIKLIKDFSDNKFEVANKWVLDNIDEIKSRLNDSKYVLFDKQILENMNE